MLTSLSGERDTFNDLVTSDGASDTDADGDTDLDEWLRGTDPTDPNSKFVLQVVPQPDSSKIVLWTGSLNRVCDLEWSKNLQEFTTIATGIPGLAPLLERLDELHNSNPNGFYQTNSWRGGKKVYAFTPCISVLKRPADAGQSLLCLILPLTVPVLNHFSSIPAPLRSLQRRPEADHSKSKFPHSDEKC